MTNEIKPEHRDLIEEVRQRLGHLLIDEFSSDFDILRWLQGHNFDVEAVVPKLKLHLRVLRSFDFRTHKWNPLMANHYPFGMLGSTGKDNNLVFIDCTGRIDGEGVTRAVPMTHVLLTTICRLELLAMPEIQKKERETGKQSGLIVVMDMEGMNNHSVSMILNSYREFGLFLTHHYAELFQKILMVNSASYIYYIWRLIKPFVPERTQAKVEILGSDWRKELLQYIEPDRLPVHWGGTMTDANGDPLYRSKIIVPVKVPQSLYWKPGPDDPPKDSLTTLSIGVGKHEFISVPVKEAGSVLKWYYYTDGDFSFGVYRTDDEKEFDIETMDMVFPHLSIVAAASKVPEIATVRCDRPGVYRIRFGNEHAWIRRLKVLYKVEVVAA